MPCSADAPLLAGVVRLVVHAEGRQDTAVVRRYAAGVPRVGDVQLPVGEEGDDGGAPDEGGGDGERPVIANGIAFIVAAGGGVVAKRGELGGPAGS